MVFLDFLINQLWDLPNAFPHHVNRYFREEKKITLIASSKSNFSQVILKVLIS